MTRKETIKYLRLDSLTPTKETSSASEFDLTQDQYASVFTLLDRNESDWNEDSESLDNSNEDIIESHYYCKTGSLDLVADLSNDTYKITIEDEEPSNG